MLPARILALAIALSLPATVAAVPNEPVRHLELSNRAHDSVASIAVATPGSDLYREVTLPGRLDGGGNAITLAVPGTACRYDLRLTFSHGVTVVYPDVEICGARVSVRPVPRQVRASAVS